MESHISTTGDSILLLYPAAVVAEEDEEADKTNLGKYEMTIANNVATSAVFNTSERSTVKKDDHHVDNNVDEDDDDVTVLLR